MVRRSGTFYGNPLFSVFLTQFDSPSDLWPGWVSGDCVLIRNLEVTVDGFKTQESLSKRDMGAGERSREISGSREMRESREIRGSGG